MSKNYKSTTYKIHICTMYIFKRIIWFTYKSKKYVYERWIPLNTHTQKKWEKKIFENISYSEKHENYIYELKSNLSKGCSKHMTFTYINSTVLCILHQDRLKVYVFIFITVICKHIIKWSFKCKYINVLK